MTGRNTDTILRGGENLAAKETEDLLHAHPHVADVAVVAIRARVGLTSTLRPMTTRREHAA